MRLGKRFDLFDIFGISSLELFELNGMLAVFAEGMAEVIVIKGQ